MPSDRQFEVLLTGSEAYPRLEQEFLNAQSEVIAGFRIFDPWTKLRSKAARHFGDVWFDLITATLNRGVEIQITLTDFDPVVRMDMHLYAWRSMRGLIAAGEASQNPQNLKVRVAMHPARVGMLPRLALWMRSTKEITKQVQDLLKDEDISPEALLAQAPGIKSLVKYDGHTIRTKLFPPPPLAPVTHHQKLAVFDGELLYIGGLDLNDRRYDTPAHNRAAPETWHDVQVLVDGPIASEARSHLKDMEDGVNGRPMRRTERLLRTLSAKRQFALPYLSPIPVISEIADAHNAAIEQSEELIYFETQFFRDEALARKLAARAREMQYLTLLMLVPAAPEDIAFSETWGPDAAFGEHLQIKCLDIIYDAFGERAFIGSPVQQRRHVTSGRDTHFDAPLIYLHAKVSIFDDRKAIISSANLNGRSLNWDTEAGVQTESAEEVAQVKQRCFSHWLGSDAGAEFYQCRSASEAWAARAAHNSQKQPEERLGLIVPYQPAKANEDARALPGVPAEMA